MPTDDLSVSDLIAEGWSSLCSGEHIQAEQAFQTALEREPLSFEARDGLLESLKSRFWYYRLIQLFGVKMVSVAVGKGRLSFGWFMFIFGGIPGAIFGVIRRHPNAAPYLWPVFLAMIGYLVVVQLTDYGSTLRVRFLPRGAPLVDGAILANAILGMLCLMGMIAAILLYFRVEHFATFLAALLLFLIIIPIDASLTTAIGQARLPMICLLLVLVALGTVSVAIAAINTQGQDWSEPIPASAGFCFLAFLAGVIGANPLATMLSQYAERTTDYVDHRTMASHPGQISLSDSKLKEFHPELYGLRALLHGWLYEERGVSAKEAREIVRQHLMYGDSRAAVVISINPPLIAAYTDEFDAIAVLRFDESFTAAYGLRQGARLLTVNTYDDDSVAPDLRPGKSAATQFKNFWPIIAQFLTDDLPAVEQKMRRITEDEWLRTAKCGQQYLRNPWAAPRDGHPLRSLASTQERS